MTDRLVIWTNHVKALAFAYLQANIKHKDEPIISCQTQSANVRKYGYTIKMNDYERVNMLYGRFLAYTPCEVGKTTNWETCKMTSAPFRSRCSLTTDTEWTELEAESSTMFWMNNQSKQVFDLAGHSLQSTFEDLIFKHDFSYLMCTSPCMEKRQVMVKFQNFSELLKAMLLLVETRLVRCG